MVEVHLAAPLRPLAGGAKVVKAEGRDLREVLNSLEARYPGFEERLLEPDGNIKPSVLIFVNSEDVSFSKGVQTPVEGGDIVYVLTAVMGGRAK